MASVSDALRQSGDAGVGSRSKHAPGITCVARGSRKDEGPGESISRPFVQYGGLQDQQSIPNPLIQNGNEVDRWNMNPKYTPNPVSQYG